MVAWSVDSHPELPIRVVGALTEAAACVGRSCKGIDLAPQPAWEQLSAALADDSGLQYLSDISYLPSPGRKPHGGISTPLFVGLAVLVAGGLSTAAFSLLRRRRRGRRWFG